MTRSRSEETARALRREHAELGDHLGDLRAMLARSPLDLPKLLHLLRALDANIARHFAFEETDGYLADVPRSSASVSREISALRDQHRSLRTSLSAIRERAEKREGIDLPQELEAWIALLSRHERRESELLLTLLADDPSGGE